MHHSCNRHSNKGNNVFFASTFLIFFRLLIFFVGAIVAVISIYTAVISIKVLVVNYNSRLATSGIMYGSMLSDDSSQHSDPGLLNDCITNGVVNHEKPQNPVSKEFAQGYPFDEEWHGYINNNDRVLLKMDTLYVYISEDTKAMQKIVLQPQKPVPILNHKDIRLWACQSKLTRKSDVYSFGVVLLEVLSGRPAVDESLDEDQWGLAPWAQDRILEGKLNRTIDTRLTGKISSKCLKTFADIACRCLHDIPNLSEKIRQEISLIRVDSLASFSCHCLLWILQAIGCKCKDSTPDADELGLTPKKPETPSGSLVNCDLVSNPKTEINGLNPTPDANELELTSKKPETPCGSA
ncbi:concanavalin A-like lectin/glucanase [Tanacetum coccineum]|uniref:Concanavalin A-like lectin/glucanase n=1 Tax=Tanacetum coccineum TaxID=301880 RepID=A0ABQ5IQS8_9ASTR